MLQSLLKKVLGGAKTHPLPDKPAFYYDPQKGPGLGKDGARARPAAKQLVTDVWLEILPLMAQESIDFSRLRSLAAARKLVWEHHDFVMTFIEFLEKAEVEGDFSFDKGVLIAKRNLTHLLKAGRMRTAVTMATAMHEKWPAHLGEAAKALLHVGQAPVASGLMDRPWTDVQVVDKGAANTLVVFCAPTNMFCFLLNEMHLWFGRLDANVIYVRDFNMALYQKGLRSVGDHAASVEHLRGLIAKLGNRRVVTTGHSGGVFGALTMGRDLGADAVAAFSGPSRLDMGLAAKEDRPFYANVQALLDSGMMTMPDLRADYERTGIRVEYLFGALNEFDTEQAQTLEGLPNVTLHPVPGVSRHSVLPEMIADGSFVSVFEDLLAG